MVTPISASIDIVAHNAPNDGNRDDDANCQSRKFVIVIQPNANFEPIKPFSVSCSSALVDTSGNNNSLVVFMSCSLIDTSF